MNPKCETCKFFNVGKEVRNLEEIDGRFSWQVSVRLGQCRLKAPVMFQKQYVIETKWPFVTTSDWCREHQPILENTQESKHSTMFSKQLEDLRKELSKLDYVSVTVCKGQRTSEQRIDVGHLISGEIPIPEILALELKMAIEYLKMFNAETSLHTLSASPESDSPHKA